MNNAETDCAYNIHKKIYPASTTKILTALVALENGNLSDTVTVADEADSGKFAADEQTCGIKAGDQLTLEDLLNGLLYIPATTMLLPLLTTLQAVQKNLQR